jgi:hypothetical protein
MVENPVPKSIIRNDEESDNESEWCVHVVAPSDAAPLVDTSINNGSDMATAEDEDASSQPSGDGQDAGEAGGDDLDEDAQSSTD